MHESKEFKLYLEVINYSNYVRKYVLPDISSVHRDLRIYLLDEIYNLKKYLVSAQYTKGNIRIKYLTDLYVTVCMIDIITTEIKEFCPNSSKHIVSAIKSLTKIKNMIYAWRQNPEPTVM